MTSYDVGMTDVVEAPAGLIDLSKFSLAEIMNMNRDDDVLAASIRRATADVKADETVSAFTSAVTK